MMNCFSTLCITAALSLMLSASTAPVAADQSGVTDQASARPALAYLGGGGVGFRKKNIDNASLAPASGQNRRDSGWRRLELEVQSGTEAASIAQESLRVLRVTASADRKTMSVPAIYVYTAEDVLQRARLTEAGRHEKDMLYSF